MKNISVLLSMSWILLISCNKNPQPTPTQYVNGRKLTSQELGFIPYQLNDTFSFSNSAGDSLKYTCISRIESRYNENGCPAYYDHCTIYNYDQLVTILACKDSLFNFNISIFQSGRLFQANLYKRPDQYSQYFEIDSSCGMKSGCIDSIMFNNKKYYNVAKLDNPSSLSSVLDSLYYSKQYGILRFCLADGSFGRRGKHCLC